jgi:hypothetical protein
MELIWAPIVAGLYLRLMMSFDRPIDLFFYHRRGCSSYKAPNVILLQRLLLPRIQKYIQSVLHMWTLCNPMAPGDIPKRSQASKSNRSNQGEYTANNHIPRILRRLERTAGTLVGTPNTEW